MSFARRLRDREKQESDQVKAGIPLPVGKGFRPEIWTDAFHALTNNSPEDRNGYEAGLFLFGRLELARKKFEELGQHIAVFDPGNRALALCSYLNTYLAKALADDAERNQGEHYDIERMLSDRPFGHLEQSGYTLNEALQLFTDGVKFPLRSAVGGATFGVGSPSRPELTHQAAIDNEVLLGRIYDSFESVWQSVQWHGSLLHRRGLEYVVDELSSTNSIERCIDLFRRARRIASTGHEISSFFQRQPLLFKRIPIVEGQTLALRSIDSISAKQRLLVHAIEIQRDSTAALELKRFLAEIHPKLNLSIEKILEIWGLLSIVASQCLERAITSDPGPLSDEIAYMKDVPVFLRSQLVETISACASVSPEQVCRVLDRFTFLVDPHRGHVDKRRRDELWDRPLVRHGDHLALVWQPLVNCEYTRLISKLAKDVKELQEQHAEKGRVFENYVSEVLHGLLTHCSPRIRGHLQMMRARIEPTDFPLGDVDAVLIIGDTALVMECRTLPHVATAYEYWDAENDLLYEKGTQAIRKRDYLRKNPNWLASLAAEEGTSIRQEIKKYVAVVVSNSFMFEGGRSEEPYYLHVDTLSSILSSGGVRFEDWVDGKEVAYFVDYFNGTENPAEAMMCAVAKPAKAEVYRKCLNLIELPLAGLEKNDFYGWVRQWVVKIPEDGQVLELLKRCSFAHLLKEVTAQGG